LLERGGYDFQIQAKGKNGQRRAAEYRQQSDRPVAWRKGLGGAYLVICGEARRDSSDQGFGGFGRVVG